MILCLTICLVAIVGDFNVILHGYGYARVYSLKSDVVYCITEGLDGAK